MSEFRQLLDKYISDLMEREARIVDEMLARIAAAGVSGGVLSTITIANSEVTIDVSWDPSLENGVVVHDLR